MAQQIQTNVEMQRVATQLDTHVSRRLEEDDPNMLYFVHGSSTGAWPADAIGIDPWRGSQYKDFGRGFYTFAATPEGVLRAGDRARQVAASPRGGGYPFVLLVGVEKSRYNLLRKKDFRNPAEAPQYIPFVNMYRSGHNDGITNNDVVIGPVAYFNGSSHQWEPSSWYPDQFKFEGRAALPPTLKPICIVATWSFPSGFLII